MRPLSSCALHWSLFRPILALQRLRNLRTSKLCSTQVPAWLIVPALGIAGASNQVRSYIDFVLWHGESSPINRSLALANPSTAQSSMRFERAQFRSIAARHLETLNQSMCHQGKCRGHGSQPRLPYFSRTFAIRSTAQSISSRVMMRGGAMRITRSCVSLQRIPTSFRASQ